MTKQHKTVSLPIRAKLADPKLWCEAGQEVCLGCINCPELRWCGGLNIQASVFNCMDLCCGKPATCKKYACPNQHRYSDLVNQVGGLELRPYRRGVAPML